MQMFSMESSGSAKTWTLRPGEVIARRYRIERVLGKGGMGTVFAARHILLNRPVAIKCLRPEFAQRPHVLARFQREMQATSRLRSEHVIRVLDAGTLPMDGDGVEVPFLVLEYLEGTDLRDLVMRNGPLSPDIAAQYIAEVCEALAEAHALGIVHRDVKPANLFRAVWPDGQSSIKLLDFGIAKFMSVNTTGDEVDVTLAGMMLGSWHYAAPEQLRSSKDVDPRADIWSLGVVLHYLATGTLPYCGESPHDIALGILNDPPPSIRALRPEVPAAFEVIVHQCLQKDPADRFASAAELARALAPLTHRSFRPSASLAQLAMKTLPFAHVLESLASRATTLPTAPVEGTPGAQAIATINRAAFPTGAAHPAAPPPPARGSAPPPSRQSFSRLSAWRMPTRRQRLIAALGVVIALLTIAGVTAVTRVIHAMDLGEIRSVLPSPGS